MSISDMRSRRTIFWRIWFVYYYKFQLSEEDYPNAKDLDKYLNKSGLKLEYNSTFKNAISFNKSVVHVPTDVYNGGKNTFYIWQPAACVQLVYNFDLQWTV